jgi:hypothetical protein
MAVLLPYQDFSDDEIFNDWQPYNTTTAETSKSVQTLDNGTSMTFLQIESTKGALANTAFGCYSTYSFPIIKDEEYALEFLVACHPNAFTDLRYTYILTAGDTTIPNYRLASQPIETLELIATMTTGFKLKVYKYRAIFKALYTDSQSRLLIGSRVSKDLTATNYGLIYVGGIVLEDPRYEERIINSLKTDWLPSDYYNAEDLNRVEQATLVVRDRVIKFRGQLVPIEPTVTNRDETRIEFADSLNRIETNILRLKLTFPETYVFNPSKTEWTHDMPFSFADARRLEQDLYDMWYRIENNISNIPYAGQLYAGELGVVF